MVQTELDSIVNQYTDKFNNPMVMWGKYRKGWLKTTLPSLFSSITLRWTVATEPCSWNCCRGR